jgi:hypothetical protein
MTPRRARQTSSLERGILVLDLPASHQLMELRQAAQTQRWLRRCGLRGRVLADNLSPTGRLVSLGQAGPMVWCVR